MSKNPGFIYIIKNVIYNYYGPDVYKIGKTKDVKSRAGNYSTYYIDKCDVLYESALVNDYNLCETILFKIINKNRLSENREFFEGDIEYFKNIIDHVVNAINLEIINHNHLNIDGELLNGLCKSVKINNNKVKKEYNLKGGGNLKKNGKYRKKHICNKCQKVFEKKSNYLKHINKKNPCDQRGSKCEYCEKEFSRRAYMKKHTEKCKLKNQDKITNKNETNSTNKNINGPVVNSTGDNNTINTTNIINITINPFLQDDMSKLSDKQKINILKKYNISIPEIIKQFNSSQNISDDDTHQKSINIMDLTTKYNIIENGKKWIINNVDKLIDNIINKKKDNHAQTAEELFDEFEEEIPEKIIDIIRDIFETLDYDPLSDEINDKEKILFRKKIIDSVKKSLYND
jgi:hypothetical protein